MGKKLKCNYGFTNADAKVILQHAKKCSKSTYNAKWKLNQIQIERRTALTYKVEQYQTPLIY